MLKLKCTVKNDEDEKDDDEEDDEAFDGKTCSMINSTDTFRRKSMFVRVCGYNF